MKKLRPRESRDADEGARQALLYSMAGDDEEAEPEDVGDGSEADQWNDADFEVIEMDDTSLISSPSKASSSPPGAPSSSKNTLDSSGPASDAAGLATMGASVSLLNDSELHRAGDSPRIDQDSPN